MDYILICDARLMPKECLAMKAQRLSQCEHGNSLVNAISRVVALGRGTETVITTLEREEARKTSVLKDLAELDELAGIVSLDEKRLVKQLRERLGDLPALFGRHIPLARRILRTLLNGHILCEPIEEGGKPGYRFTATGTFDRLLTGATLINHGGGGEGS
jgi:hypothetical protein